MHRLKIDLLELVHGRHGWLVAPEDPNALTDAIIILSTDAECHQHLKQGAVEWLARSNWERRAARTTELFEGVKRET